MQSSLHKTNKPSNFSKQFKQIYGDNFYLGINRLGVPFEDLIITKSQQISASLDIPLVVTNDVYYLKRESQFLCDILSCIQTGRRISEVNTSKFDSKEMYLKSPEEMTELFKDIPEAISNTVKIANQCKISLETETVKLPNFKCPDGLDDVSYLKKLVDEGLQKKYGTITDEIKERVKFELDIINKMHYAPYFLIIFDFLKFSRDNNIPVGPGRGSAAGSIVAYVLDITRIDPIEYKLLFERFLNPERVSMPDVDIDFCIKRRNEVIDYIVNAYGTDHVSQIVTFGTMAARGVVRDVSRVLDIPLNEVDTIAKLIPSGPGNSMSIPEAIESISELNEKVNANPKIKEMMDIAIKLEGLYRHCSTHAAGVVISKDPLSDVVPLIKNDGQIVTQFSMVDLESVGLLKMDILGLRNLTVIQDCLELIKQNHNKTLDLDSIGYDDKATYDLLCTGKTVGIFQLESQGMRNLIKDLQPQTFNDLIALLALYRPGPLGSGMVNDFISNKSGKTEVQYDLPELEPILKETYGMIVYQEQVMQIASVIGGFSLGQADMLRRAMGKKKKSVMDEMKETFLKGAESKQINLDKANKVFELCYKFAEYGFNKSHSAAYSVVSYHTAYLKTHYPAEYMTALLSSVQGVSEKISLYIQESIDMNLQILPPNVNESTIDFVTKDNKIRFGLGSVKNVGDGAIENIVQKRRDGNYKSLMDFCTKVDLKVVNKRVIESLIKVGAFDEVGKRDYMLSIYEQVIDRAQVIEKEQRNGQIGLFGNTDTGTGVALLDDQNLTPQYIGIQPGSLLQMEKSY